MRAKARSAAGGRTAAAGSPGSISYLTGEPASLGEPFKSLGRRWVLVLVLFIRAHPVRSWAGSSSRTSKRSNTGRQRRSHGSSLT